MQNVTTPSIKSPSNSNLLPASPSGVFAKTRSPIAIPFMLQKPAKKQKGIDSRIPRQPNLRAHKFTDEARAKLVTRIRRVTDPACLPPAPIQQSYMDSARQNSQAYVTDPLVSTAFYLAQSMFGVMQSVKNYLPEVSIGPVMAEAKTIASAPMNVASFIKTFQKDFQLYISPSFKGDSLQGVTVIVGEQHSNFEVYAINKKIMALIQVEKGDLLLAEGIDIHCQAYSSIFKIPLKSCVAIENNTLHYAQINDAHTFMLSETKKAAQYLYKNIAASDKPAKIEFDKMEPMREFINKYAYALPSQFRTIFSQLQNKAVASQIAFSKLVPDLDAKREKNMAENIRKWSSVRSTNFVIVGAAHARNLARNNFGGNVIFAMPRILIQAQPDLALPLQTKTEL